MNPLIEIKDLSAGYDGGKPVLHNVNLTLYPHDFLGVIGPNGGGKTTLLKCILGLLKPQAGEVRFHPTRPHSTGRTGMRLGYLPQYSHIDRKFPITVWETILSGLISEAPLFSSWKKEQQERARQVIARMGLEGLEQRPIGALSGGELQRVLLGRAVISDPEVLILDEPGTYIDRRSEARLYELLEEWGQTCAIVLVSHDIEALLHHAHSLAVVNRAITYYSSVQGLNAHQWDF